ncbi:MAG: glycosyl hydrolase [Propionibacteriales bacterium]|nr:glycosyl hydrolase [Propionibacteriales bacterium]
MSDAQPIEPTGDDAPTERPGGPTEETDPVDEGYPPQAAWSHCADAAEQALVERHVRPLLGMGAFQLGVVSWPPTWRHRLMIEWHYWWQAHLIDCAVDAYARDATDERRDRVAALTRGHRLRNVTGWTNNYFDDMAWLALALERADRLVGVPHRVGLAKLTRQLVANWTERTVTDDGVVTRIGGLPWRKRDDFFNTPANGPAAILMARVGRVGRARQMADWMREVLRDEASGLMLDGIRPRGMASEIYSYCQGVTIGAEVELAVRTGDKRHTERVADLVRAVSHELTDDQGVIVGGGGGDGGLFNGILARYLALAATDLPGDSPLSEVTRDLAAEIILASAAAAWQHRVEIDQLPLFGHDWSRPATLPSSRAEVGGVTDGAITASSVPERDLSVQLGGWKLMEAAVRVAGR